MNNLIVFGVYSSGNIGFDEVIISAKFKILIKETVVYFSGNAHETNSFIANLANDSLAFGGGAFRHPSGQILSCNQVSNKEFSELTGQYI
jgi:hypothetical protein